MARMRHALLVSITGRVQGVAFRAWTKREADRLDVKGWVRNETDGSVSALLAGPDAAVSAMVELLRSGPRLASVSGLETRPVEIDDMPASFSITAV